MSWMVVVDDNDIKYNAHPWNTAFIVYTTFFFMTFVSLLLLFEPVFRWTFYYVIDELGYIPQWIREDGGKMLLSYYTWCIFGALMALGCIMVGIL